MPDNRDPPAPGIGISLANGQVWRFRPTDAGSADVIRRLAGVMRLSPTSTGTELFVTVREVKREERNLAQSSNPLISILPSGINAAMEAIQMTDLAKVIALETLPTGGMLIHGALAERDGYGVILAASGGTGKTTASTRLPPPWRSHSDDATLVVRDNSGNYIAHPWPTWSRFFDNGPGGSWEVERGVPLAAIFFLSQSQEDHAEPLNISDAVAFLMESVHQIMGPQARRTCIHDETESRCRMELVAAEALARGIPAYLLHISLTGKFWEAIEGVIGQRAGAPHQYGTARDTHPAKSVHWTGKCKPLAEMFGAGHIPIVYSGPSMNPTLIAPDLLEVVPYSEGAPAVGDIICFTRPGNEMNIVHRITRINGTSIQTRGDNNPIPDADLVHSDWILGRVVSATRGDLRRRIAGGLHGQVIRSWLCIRKSALQKISGLLCLAKPVLGITRASSRLLPGSWKPRIVLFSSRNTSTMKLFFRTAVIGEFTTTRGVWTIRFPFRLLVNETALPTLERPEPARTTRSVPIRQ